jgi:predicted RNase H-like nuclease
LFPLLSRILTYKERFSNVWECAEFLGVNKESFEHAVKVYARMYEKGLSYQNYRILFRANGTIGVSYDSLVDPKTDF